MIELPPDEPPRMVRVRTPKHTHRPVIALDSERVLMETGQILNLAALPYLLSAAESSIIVCQGFGDALALLIETYADHKLFQYRATPRGENLLADHLSADTLVNFVGFKADNHTANRYHYPLDPQHFCRAGIDDIYPPGRKADAARKVADTVGLMGEPYLLTPEPDNTHICRLMRWGLAVRDWCAHNQLEVKPSAGGLAAQLLRDPKFYPEPRRKVPRLINAIARKVLPGNHYELYANTDRPLGYRALYLDMHAAHHFVAASIRFPDANTLHAYGNWNENDTRPFASGNSHLLGDPLLGRSRFQHAAPGLYHLALTIPHLGADRFAPPAFWKPGQQNVWLFSNELDPLAEFGVNIDGIIAALISEDADVGLNAYAKFALAELHRMPKSEKPWLKPTLHSAYGLLAARAVQFETGFHQSLGGTPKEYLIGRHSIPVKSVQAKATTETKIVNVIHRGMIEAEVRRQVLDTCRMLTESDGREVLAIYADSIIIRDNRRDEDGEVQLRMLPPPWQIKDSLTNVRFIDSTHFTANEFSRLPGFPRNRDEARRVDDYRRLMDRQHELSLPQRLAKRAASQ